MTRNRLNFPLTEYLPTEEKTPYRDEDITQAVEDANRMPKTNGKADADLLRTLSRRVDAINTQFNPAVEWNNEQCSDITDAAYVMFTEDDRIYRELAEGALEDYDAELVEDMARALCRLHHLTAERLTGHDYPASYPLVIPTYTVREGTEEYLPEEAAW